MKKRYVKIPPPGTRKPSTDWYIIAWLIIIWLMGILVGYTIRDCMAKAEFRPVTVTQTETVQTEQIELRQIVSEPTQAEPIIVRPTTPPEQPEPYYILTEEETILVEQVVMAEAGGESHRGQISVAQCIRDTAIRDGLSVAEVIIEYKYTPDRKEPSESVQRAVAAVFDDGESAIETAYYFYSPLNMPNGVSKWHEAQEFVTELGGHRFFR